jgi:hypothetical protein
MNKDAAAKIVDGWMIILSNRARGPIRRTTQASLVGITLAWKYIRNVFLSLC